MDQVQGSQVSTPLRSLTHLTQGENEFGFAAAKPKKKSTEANMAAGFFFFLTRCEGEDLVRSGFLVC